MSQPDVSIIIVNWNVSELLDICLRTIKHYTKGISYEVIVVDSASSDDSVQMVQKKHPWVQLIASPDNLGFTKGNNRGLEVATGRHIAYINPDIEFVEDALTPMIEYLDAHIEVGAIGCALLNTDRSHQNSIGRFLRLSTLWQEYVLRSKAETVHIPHPKQPAEVEVVLGACLVVRGNLAREIGGFDTRYFMYQEETDLCLALKQRGFSTVYYPVVAMIHHGSKSATKSDESRQRTLYENRRSQSLFMHKHYGAATAFVADLLIFSAMAIRLPVLYLLQFKPNQKQKNQAKLTYYLKTMRNLAGF